MVFPIKAGRRYVPPAPGMMPSRVSGRATREVDPNTRKSVVRASSRPPPKAIEAMAVIVGIGSSEIFVKVLRRRARKASVLIWGEPSEHQREIRFSPIMAVIYVCKVLTLAE